MLYCSITQLKLPHLKVGKAWCHRERQDVMIVQMLRIEHIFRQCLLQDIHSIALKCETEVQTTDTFTLLNNHCEQ